MPCMCWYTPHETDVAEVKRRCVELVTLVKSLNERGDPVGLELHNIHELIDHLYYPERCKEAPAKPESLKVKE